MSETRETESSSPQASSTHVGSGRFYELGRMSGNELETIFLRGALPKLERLAGWEFRGMNHPAWAKIAGIKKFMKGFYWDERQLFGYNCPVVQDGVEMPWRSKPVGCEPRRFGFYRVAKTDPTAKDNAYLHSVLLNYGEGGNKPFDPSSGLRDYLVQVDENNPDLYLGKAYYAVGPLRVRSNFFLLERERQVAGPIVR
ncbi:MAG: hypothetical protein GY811_08000 [Myxococcales bacterium]|nr:hypothetical protein [Myxococcales bacterium]